MPKVESKRKLPCQSRQLKNRVLPAFFDRYSAGVISPESDCRCNETFSAEPPQRKLRENSTSEHLYFSGRITVSSQKFWSIQKYHTRMSMQNYCRMHCRRLRHVDGDPQHHQHRKRYPHETAFQKAEGDIANQRLCAH